MEPGATAATFSVGFFASAVMSPFIGMAMDRFGPRLVFPVGGLMVAGGFMAATLTTSPGICSPPSACSWSAAVC